MKQTLMLVSALGVLAFAGPVTAGPGDKGAYIIFAPTDIAEAYPMEARKTGKDADVTLHCLLTSEGGLRACVTKEESPKGLGFARAAMALTPEMMIEPEFKAGKAVDTVIDIPIHFTGTDALGSRIKGVTVANVASDPYSSSNRSMITDVDWTQAPTYDQVVAAYPAQAKAKMAGGRAALMCFIGEGGVLGQCTVQAEYPSDLGLGAAAKSLAGLFKAPVKTASGESTAGKIIILPVAFSPRMLSGSGIGAPILLAAPDAKTISASLSDAARKASAADAKVVLRCVVQQGGYMAGCKADSETPANLGLADSALKVAPKFRVNPWSDEGLPVVAAPVRLPVKFDLAGAR